MHSNETENRSSMRPQSPIAHYHAQRTKPHYEPIINKPMTEANHDLPLDDYEALLEAANINSEEQAFALKLQIQGGLRPQTAAEIAQAVSPTETFDDNSTQ